MTDWDVVEAMRTYGGSFVHALAVCYQRADAENQHRLKAAFPELWVEYQELAVKARRG
jgi:hypothetical protein